MKDIILITLEQGWWKYDIGLVPKSTGEFGREEQPHSGDQKAFMEQKTEGGNKYTLMPSTMPYWWGWSRK